MKICLIGISVLSLMCEAWAGILVTDDFDRVDTPLSSDTSLIDSNWKQAAGSADEWLIAGNYLHSHALGGGAGILYNDEMEIVCGNGTNFVLNFDVASKRSGAWAGVVFNYQDDSNYYVIRFRSNSVGYQVLKVVGGSVGVLAYGSTSTNVVQEDVFYTVTVESDTAYVFNVTITAAGQSEVFGEGQTTDGSNNFTGGYAGVYAPGVGYSAGHDNFSLYVGEPILTPGDDDFNRADVARTSDTSLLGGSWQVDDSADLWTISGGVMHSYSTAAPGILYNIGLECLSGSTSNFTLRVDVCSKMADVWSGVVFNYQDGDNYYYVKFLEGSTAYRMGSVVGGVESVIVDQGDALMPFAEDLFYTINAASVDVGKFEFTIMETGSSTVLNPVTNAVDVAVSLTGGYAGLYAEFVGYASKFDNFFLQQVEIKKGYASWADQWGDVNIGAETEDYDGDGQLNIYEYGLGGDPTNQFVQGVPPEFFIRDVGEGDEFCYVHPQLSDPESGLTYFLELSEDLTSGIWTNTGYIVAGTNITGGSLNFVTNITDMVVDEKFIRLVIE